MPPLQQTQYLSNKRGDWYYFPDGKEPALTHILDCIAKPALIRWAAKSAAEIALTNPTFSVDEIVGGVFAKRTTAAERGKEVHRIAEGVLKADLAGSVFSPEHLEELLLRFPDDLKGHGQAFFAWYFSLRPKILFSEFEIRCHELRYAGTTDLGIQVVSGEKWLIDFKTGGVYDEAGLQLKGYEHGIVEMAKDGRLLERGIDLGPEFLGFDRKMVVQLRSNGGFDTRTFNDSAEALKNVIGTWRWQNHLPPLESLKAS